MNFRKFLKRWLGYTRRERTGSAILILVLLLVLLIRTLDPGRTPAAEESPGDGTDSLYQAVSVSEGIASDSLYVFDPNSAGRDILLGLGLSERQVRTIINYRNTGARFRNPGDFRKVYGIDKDLQDRLLPYILIKDLSRSAATTSPVQAEDIKAGTEHLHVIPADNINGSHPRDSAAGSGSHKNVNTHAGTNNTYSTGIPATLDINHADSADFERLPGIGPVLAARIIKYRNLLGYYYKQQQLSEVYGLRPEVIAMNSNLFSCDSMMVKKISINTAAYPELLRHPYLSRGQVEAITTYRRLSGKFSNLSELVRNRILNHEEAKHVEPYLEFR